MSTMASTALNGMNNTITVNNKNNDAKSSLKLSYTFEQEMPDGQSDSVSRSITLNAPFFMLKPSITQNEDGASSLEIYDAKAYPKNTRISVQDGDTITIGRKQNKTIEITRNNEVVNSLTYKK